MAGTEDEDVSIWIVEEDLPTELVLELGRHLECQPQDRDLVQPLQLLVTHAYFGLIRFSLV